MEEVGGEVKGNVDIVRCEFNVFKGVVRVLKVAPIGSEAGGDDGDVELAVEVIEEISLAVFKI